MKYLFFLPLVFFLSTLNLHAQETIAFPDSLSGWKSSWSVGISGSQASYSNWAQGGINNVAATGRTTFTSVYRMDRFSYGLLVHGRFGKTRIQNEGVRKIDDRIVILNRFLYDLSDESTDFKMFGNLRFRSQFDDGFEYGKGKDGSDRLISAFLAPVYFTQDAGIAYIPNETFSVETGLGLQQTFVRDRALGPVFGLDPGSRFRSEAGLTFALSVHTGVAGNLTYKGSLSTFTSFNKPLKSTDLFLSNTLTGKINSFMNATVSLDFVYDDDFSKELQVAQVLSLGVVFTLR